MSTAGESAKQPEAASAAAGMVPHLASKVAKTVASGGRETVPSGGAGFNLLYSTMINPGLTEVILEAQTEKFEAAGMSADAAEKATAMVRKMMHPAVQSAIGFVMGLFVGTLVSLVTAAFLKRPATDEVVSA